MDYRTMNAVPVVIAGALLAPEGCDVNVPPLDLGHGGCRPCELSRLIKACLQTGEKSSPDHGDFGCAVIHLAEGHPAAAPGALPDVLGGTP